MDSILCYNEENGQPHIQEGDSPMKNNKWTKAILAAVIMVMCTLMMATAFAGTSTERSGGSSSLYDLPPFKFEKHMYGLGYGNCPIYTAPSESSYRANNGKASVATNGYEVDDAGFVDGWLLVRYEIKSGWRVGYIPPKYVRGFVSSMAPHFGWIPCTANETIYVTDNVYSHNDSFAVLEPGEQFSVISQYDYYANKGYDWWYIECEVDGQIARGFIEKTADFSVN